MKKLALLMLLPFAASSQTDTIFKKDGTKIICVITFVNNDNIFFSEKKDAGKLIDVKEVFMYSKGGTRIDPSKKITILDTSNGILLPVKDTDTIPAALELEHMKYCFRRFSGQHYVGAATLGIGISLSALGVFVEDTGATDEGGLYVSGLGLVMTVVGSIIMIDSHKWMHRAGFGVNGKGNSVGIYYTFK